MLSASSPSELTLKLSENTLPECEEPQTGSASIRRGLFFGGFPSYLTFPTISPAFASVIKQKSMRIVRILLNIFILRIPFIALIMYLIYYKLDNDFNTINVITKHINTY